MKTAGQILSEIRRKKSISIFEISKKTKIDVRHIKAIEEDRYGDLPSPTFIKGFIRNIALSLGDDPEKIVAIFRRDFKEEKPKNKEGFKFDFKKKSLNIKLLMFVGTVLLFMGYILFQYRMVLRPPKLVIETPKDKEVVTSPVKVEGISEVGVSVVVEGKTVKPDLNGYFSRQIELDPGEKTIAIEAISRFGKSNRQELQLTIISRD
jgi:cytoskeletal protein RodZ